MSSCWCRIIQKPLEPSCCKKQQQKSPRQEAGLGNRGRLMVLNNTKLILNLLRGHSCSFRTNLVSSLFPKPVSCPGLFFVISYSKRALVFIYAFIWLQECIEREVCGIKSSNNCDNMASWPSNLIKLLRFLKVKASKSTFGLWLLRFLRFRRPAGTIMALLLFAALLLLLILMLLVFKFYDEFITCFHEF